MERKKYTPELVNDRLNEYYKTGIESLFDDGLQWQEKVLQDIIELGNQSEYAKDKGFFGIHSKEEFFEKVPLSNYQDYLPYIMANMRSDSNQVSSLKTDHYLLSTGKQQKGKYYIETSLGSLARQTSINLWNINLTRLEPQMSMPNVKMMAVTNCSPIESAPNGKAVRRTSGQAARELWEKMPDLYVFPYEFLEAEMSEEDRDYLTALYVLKEPLFNMLFCNNLTYFGVLLERIESDTQKMIDDIMHGTMSVSMSEDDRRILLKKFKAEPQRAKHLQSLLAEKGQLLVEDIWPDFVFTGSWLAGSVGDYSKDVMRRLPEEMRYLSESYGCSEGMINIPLRYNEKYGPLAVYSCYFEFIPLNGGNIKSMAEVEDGEYYELVISTYSGLYRYRLHDIVRVCGYTGHTPNIEFCCRSEEKIVVSGETIYGYEFSALVNHIEQDYNCNIDFYQLIDQNQGFSLILQSPNNKMDFLEISKIIANELKKRRLTFNKIYWVTDKYRSFLYRLLMNNGRTIQCIKLPIVTKRIPEDQYIKMMIEADVGEKHESI